MASHQPQDVIRSLTTGHRICRPLPQTVLHNLSCSCSSCPGLSLFWNLPTLPMPQGLCTAILSVWHTFCLDTHMVLCFISFRPLLQCQRRLIWLYQVKQLLGTSPLTLLLSLWSTLSDILYSIVYALFPQLESQCLQGGGSCCFFLFFFFFLSLNSQHLRVGPGE